MTGHDPQPTAAEALPCPFCGQHPEVDHGETGATIECVNRECWGPSVFADHEEHHNGYDLAVAQWNRRAEQKAGTASEKLSRLLAWIDKLQPPITDGVNGDWACAECKPYSASLVEGFRCAYHDAKAAAPVPAQGQGEAVNDPQAEARRDYWEARDMGLPEAAADRYAEAYRLGRLFFAERARAEKAEAEFAAVQETVRDMADVLGLPTGKDKPADVLAELKKPKPAAGMNDAKTVNDFCALNATKPAAEAGGWTKEPPSKQGRYWHWNGSEDDAPLPLMCMWSGGARKCFVCIGQFGITQAIDCDAYGGWWMPVAEPSIPEVECHRTDGKFHGRDMTCEHCAIVEKPAPPAEEA